MQIKRRALVALGTSALALGNSRTDAASQSPVQQALASFAALPATTGGLVSVVQGNSRWEVDHDADSHLFMGSAVKTFILAEVLRQCESGRLSEDQPILIDDRVRSLVSPVFADLSGHAPLRIVLEAMISHSDNTATDAALGACGVAPVRALIAQANLRQTEIPISTRQFFSYLAGAPYGTDLGWAGMEALRKGKDFGKTRVPLNGRETMASTAREMVAWYEKALSGAFFSKPETTTEYKRILSMGDAIPLVVPAGIAAYAKGGSIDWEDFHCFALAGQMILDGTPASFCFAINWTGPADGVAPMFDAYRQAVAGVLEAARKAFT
ncbi:MAG TPA: serine hydrolase [Acidisoma sp.]|jgi:beta-lactamase class A|uniref:serine hydrolase n=1 Tax=Acidisoma sp. TaxID=1872115 RepID=UPI002C2D5ED2|nr:serine hydrolase [Acidisoma sp.]HTI02657.1 serine hydrolase [Acidisoma sp.]